MIQRVIVVVALILVTSCGAEAASPALWSTSAAYTATGTGSPISITNPSIPITGIPCAGTAAGDIWLLEIDGTLSTDNMANSTSMRFYGFVLGSKTFAGTGGISNSASGNTEGVKNFHMEVTMQATKGCTPLTDSSFAFAVSGLVEYGDNGNTENAYRFLVETTTETVTGLAPTISMMATRTSSTEISHTMISAHLIKL